MAGHGSWLPSSPSSEKKSTSGPPGRGRGRGQGQQPSGLRVSQIPLPRGNPELRVSQIPLRPDPSKSSSNHDLSSDVQRSQKSVTKSPSSKKDPSTTSPSKSSGSSSLSNFLSSSRSSRLSRSLRSSSSWKSPKKQKIQRSKNSSSSKKDSSSSGSTHSTNSDSSGSSSSPNSSSSSKPTGSSGSSSSWKSPKPKIQKSESSSEMSSFSRIQKTETSGTFEDFTIHYQTESKQYNEQLYKLYQLGYNNVTTDIGLDWNAEVILGKGSFGKVILARRRWGQPRILVGVKIMDMIINRHGEKRTPEEIKQYKEVVGNEIQTHATLTRLNHPNLVRQLADFIIDEKMFIILEYCNSQNLYEYIGRTTIYPEEFRLSERSARYWFRQLVSGLHAMHSVDIVHRDFKSENILVHRNPMTGVSILKICDFGMTVKNKQFRSVCGTPCYVSPQVLNRNLDYLQDPEKDSSYDGKPNDVWALGVVLYEMIYREEAFHIDWKTEQSIMDSMQRIASSLPGEVSGRAHEYFQNVSNTLANLFAGLFMWNPEVRLTTETVQQTNWYTHDTVDEPTKEYFSTKFPQEI